MKGRLIRARKPQSQTISCKGQIPASCEAGDLEACGGGLHLLAEHRGPRLEAPTTRRPLNRYISSCEAGDLKAGGGGLHLLPELAALGSVGCRG